MKILRTPDDRFTDLAGFSFTPHYADIADPEGGTLRAHYLDEGPRDAEPVLLMHGEPSWCYLYRKMIPVLTRAGHRCVAPDLVGFGRSDKPSSRTDYTYGRHVEWMRELLFDRLDLGRITLVGQDWGGLIGLRLAAEHEERFDRIVAANTFLPTGDHAPPEAFLSWQKFSQEVHEFPAGRIVAGGSKTPLPAEVVAAYDAPFPDESFKAGARAFPMLVPVRPDDPAAEHNRAAWKVFERWTKPFLTAFSDSDPVTAGGEKVLQSRIPGCKDQPHTTIAGGGHFLQEDKGEELAQVVVDFIARTR
ncbi:MAG TPA: haloalkane dehalogenase [Candidatus Binatia bacterium]|nr:haloalkane dehalogenase [Candidatus Binatia bacterium]